MAQEHAPLAITLDIMMPNKDGWQVLHALKNDPKTHDIPVVLVTVVDQKALGYQLGATDYLIKPLNADDLLASLSKISNREQKSKLLVVDDDPDVHEMIGQHLEDCGYHITAVADGAHALAAVKKELPDIILLDLLMPRMDGFGVIEGLRQLPETRDIPIVILTAKSLSAAEEKSLEQRIYTVIQKQGLQGEALLETIASALTKQKRFKGKS
jgi:CheY-like chemotaxis protein